ncbi:hypothetical protein B484DRAFT_418292 [Ochromonadaceae sp. CCMP2298]|nr:hypothetical protein B484DRAFT_418292 [Ochromonadaceae sp. CCMP2298]
MPLLLLILAVAVALLSASANKEQEKGKNAVTLTSAAKLPQQGYCWLATAECGFPPEENCPMACCDLLSCVPDTLSSTGSSCQPTPLLAQEQEVKTQDPPHPYLRQSSDSADPLLYCWGAAATCNVPGCGFPCCDGSCEVDSLSDTGYSCSAAGDTTPFPTIFPAPAPLPAPAPAPAPIF